MVLRAVMEHGPLLRNDIARHTGLALPTVILHVRDMLRDRLLTKCGNEKSTGGRMPEIIDINPKAGTIIGISCQKERIVSTILDLRGKSIHQSIKGNLHIETRNALLGELTRSIYEASRIAVKKLAKPKGIGVGVDGIIDIETNKVISFVGLPGWSDEPLAEKINKEFSLPTYVVPLTAAAIMGEKEYGEYGKLEKIMYIYLGTSLKQGLLNNYILERGFMGGGGELSHVQVRNNGSLCYCGKTGCLEAVIKNEIGNYKNKDLPPVRSLKKAGTYLGKGISSILNMTKPEIIIIGGPFSKQEAFLDSVRKGFGRRKPSVIQGSSVEIMAMGAAVVARRRIFLNGLQEMSQQISSVGF